MKLLLFLAVIDKEVIIVIILKRIEQFPKGRASSPVCVSVCVCVCWCVRAPAGGRPPERVAEVGRAGLRHAGGCWLLAAGWRVGLAAGG